jgi:hypothetical protein
VRMENKFVAVPILRPPQADPLCAVFPPPKPRPGSTSPLCPRLISDRDASSDSDVDDTPGKMEYVQERVFAQ